MKKITAMAAISLALTGCITTQPDPIPPLELTSIHDIPGKSKAAICEGARDWVAMTFKDSKSVIEVFDVERGKIIGKGGVYVYGNLGIRYSALFTIVIDCKNDKLRALYKDYRMHIDNAEFPLRSDSGQGFRQNAETETRRIDSALDAYLKTSESTKDF